MDIYVVARIGSHSHASWRTIAFVTDRSDEEDVFRNPDWSDLEELRRRAQYGRARGEPSTPSSENLLVLERGTV